MTTLLDVARRYKNAGIFSLNRFHVPSVSARSFLAVSRNILKQLDRSEPNQRDLAGRIWRLRTSISFTLLPFHSAQLGIDALSRGISSDIRRLPFLASEADLFGKVVSELLREDANPKLHVISMLLESCEVGSVLGVFTPMAYGRSLGRPDDDCSKSDRLVWVESPRAMRSGLFDRLLLLGGCRYLSRQAYASVFQSGSAPRIDVLLYPGETFEWSPPPTFSRGTSIRADYVRDTPFGPQSSLHEDEAAAPTIPESPSNNGNADSWEDAHAGSRTPGDGLVKSRFVMFSNGRGLFVPEDAEVLLLSDKSIDSNSELVEVHLREAREGDSMVIRAEASGYLVGAEDKELQFDHDVEVACDWRPALEEALMTAEPHEVASSMRSFGARNVGLTASIRHWADGSTYGPGGLNEFRALISVLSNSGILRIQETIDEYVADRWQRLSVLRSSRQRQAQMIRRQVLEELRSHFAKRPRTEAISVVTTTYDKVFHVCEIAAVDDKPSWVSRGRLMTLQTFSR